MADAATRELERQWATGDKAALEKLRDIDRRTQTEIPVEVWNRIERCYYSDVTVQALSGKKVNSKLADRVEPHRIRFFEKDKISRNMAWLTTAYDEASKPKDYWVKDADSYSGWRKHHTKNYWVWFALDLREEKTSPPRIRVLHTTYGCETGCCGHVLEVDDEEISESFDFAHPGETDEGIREYVREHIPAECFERIDWSTLELVPGC